MDHKQILTRTTILQYIYLKRRKTNIHTKVNKEFQILTNINTKNI